MTGRWLLMGGIAVAGCGVDLWTKELAFDRLGWPAPDSEWWIWRGYFGFETALNPGALFGYGAGKSMWFAVVSIVAAIGILVYARLGALRDRLLTVSLGAILGGIGGNLYDRLGLWSRNNPPPAPWSGNEVRDWILFRYQQYTWPNFNIADSLLVFGAAMLLWHAWLHRADGEPSSPEKSASP